MGLNTTPRTWVAGELVTAAELNTEIRDAITGIQAAWTAYTPTLTATTNPVLGTGGSITGRYLQIGKTIFTQGRILFGSSGQSFGTGNWNIGLPVTASAANLGPIGQVVILPSGAVWAPAWAVPVGGSAFQVYCSGSTTGANTAPMTGTTTPGGSAWAAGADLRWNLTYDAA